MVKGIGQCFGVVCLILLLVSLSGGQGAQVAISGDEIVKAGEDLAITVTLDKAPNFPGGSLSVGFSAREGQGSVSTGGPTQPGQTVYHFKVVIPAAAPGGIWAMTGLQFWNSAAWVNLPHKDLSFRVISNPSIVYPTSADVEVSPSQVQLLRREILRLQAQLQMLKTSVAGAEEPLTKPTLALLRSKIEGERDSLASTEARFQELGEKSQSASAKVFFDDLRIGYAETLSQLSSKRLARTGPRVILANQRRGLLRGIP